MKVCAKSCEIGALGLATGFTFPIVGIAVRGRKKAALHATGDDGPEYSARAACNCGCAGILAGGAGFAAPSRSLVIHRVIGSLGKGIRRRSLDPKSTGGRAMDQ